MIKKESGITILALVITVVIMLILVSAGIHYGTNSISEVKLQNFSYELQQIQGRVDSISEKMGMENNSFYVVSNGQTMGQNIRASNEAVDRLYKLKGIDYKNALTSNKDLYPTVYDSIYRYFTAKDLESQLDIKNAKLDVIINFKTREVISVKGQTHEEKTYYRLEDLK